MFSGADVVVGFPFCCVDLWAFAGFTCEGFDYLTLGAYDVALGDCVWLELDEIEITYSVQTKEVTVFDLDLVFCDFACIEPFFELVQTDPALIAGIRFRGFIVECEVVPGVTFKAGTIFQRDDWLDILQWSFDDLGNRLFGEPDLVCPPNWCAVGFLDSHHFDEYFAILVDGDSCCGGGFTFSIFNWFDIGDDNLFGNAAGLFDWEKTVIDLSVDIGWNTTVVGGLSVVNEGMDWMKIGFKTRW